ncbi:MAG: AMP-binding protein [Proteobacteria bacterium]|nr:AMP-binding protein [Pseudomonadota bacterium]
MSNTFSLRPGCGRHPDRTEPIANPHPIDIPRTETLIHTVEWWAKTQPDQPQCYFIEVGRDLRAVTAQDLMHSARHMAMALYRHGVVPGDRVVLCLDTPSVIVECFLGCMVLGAIPSISDMPFGRQNQAAWRDKLCARLHTLAAHMVIVEDRTASAVGHPAHSAVVVHRDDLHSDIEYDRIGAAKDKPAFIQFTSGTASSGRGISLSHRAVMANLRAISRRGEFLDSDMLVSWLPLYHDLGLVANLLISLALGFPIVQMAPLTFLFRPSWWLWAVHHFRGTTICSPNFAFDMCVRRIKDSEIGGLDISSLRDVYNCAEFIHASTLRRFNTRFAANGFDANAWRPSYGMAEIVVGATVRRRSSPLRVDRISQRQLVSTHRAEPAPAGAEDAMEVVSCGSMFDGYSMSIVDENGREVGERVQGEIQLKGPSLFDGYYNDAAATAEVLRDSWLRTGDLGYRVGDELYVCGRSKDLIIRAGENYHPYHLERAVSEVSGVRPNVAAFGRENPALGTQELIVVFETKLTDVRQLMALCDDIDLQLSRHFGLAADRLVPVAPGVIPKTTSGKIRRSALAEILDDIDKLFGYKEATAATTHAHADELV